MWQRTYGSRSLMVAGILAVAASQGLVQPARAGNDPQTVVVDIPGIRTQGETRPAQWGPVLIGNSDFTRHNIRHEGVFGRNTQRPEPGATTTLSHRWNASQAAKQLAPALNDMRAGKNAYIKIDKNMGLGGHLFGKRGEKEWVRSVGNFLASEVKKINPNAKLILNTHSSGTIDAASLDLSRFSEVKLSSNRGSARQLKQLVDRFPNTSFTLISGNRDFPHGFGKGLMSVTAKNLTTVNINNGGLTPFAVHSNVTNPSYSAIADVKTAAGTTRMSGKLAELISGKGSVVRSSPTNFARSIGPGGCVRYPGDSRNPLRGIPGGIRTGPGNWPGGIGGAGGYGGISGSPGIRPGVGSTRSAGGGSGFSRR